MVSHSAVCALLATLFYHLIPSHGLQLPFPKCQLNDNDCLAATMTYVIRNWKKYPECKIPKLDPLELPNPVVFRSLELTSLLTAQIYYSNFTFLGIDEIQIQEIRGFHHDQPVSDAQIKMFMPKALIGIKTNADMKILSLPVKLNGRKVMNVENVEVLANFRATIVKRNGNAYAIPSNICVSNEVSNVKVVFSHQQYMPLAIANVVDGVFNSKWKMIKPLMDPTLNTFVADVIRSIVVPILDNIPLQEIINMEESTKRPHC